MKGYLVPVDSLRVAGITVLSPWRDLGAAYLAVMYLPRTFGKETIRGLSSTGSATVFWVGRFSAAIQTMVQGPVLHGNREPSLIRMERLQTLYAVAVSSQEGVEARRLPPVIDGDYGEGIVRGVGKPTQT